ncbi:collagen binding domain-containing protein [Amycolatopsis thailandensis]|uniref:MSCRAMM family protein n=1 Tax=Amycolatopsis thailandensis TaxID=589330 RepID=UPI003663A784
MKRSWVLAAVIPIAALLTAGPAAADEGVVSGVVKAAGTGEPVAGACVTLFDLDLKETGSGCAGPDGRYEIADVVPGKYKARATAAGYAELWSYNKGSALAAEVVDLPHGLDFALRQGNSTVRGLITDQGKPAAGASVSLTDQNQRWWSTVLAGADGTYSFSGVTADTYTMVITFGDRTQWIRQKASFPEADTFAVTDDQVAVVDEAIAPFGKLRVIATDEKTGAPVAGACSQFEQGHPPQSRKCAGADGVMVYEDLPPFGYYTLSVWGPDGSYYPVNSQRVELTPGQTTDFRASMKPAASIVTTVRDAKTKAPLEDICVDTYALPIVGVLDADYRYYCSDEKGRLVIGPIEPGAYKLLVKPLDERYGMQWAGQNGGTGDIGRARVVTAELGKVVSTADIKMDPAGTITGTVTDRATGAPVNGVCVYPYAVDPRIGFRFDVNCSRNGGTYTIKGLGPYDWPLEFASSRGDYAWQWSGDAADRFAARPVRVRPNATVTENAALVPNGAVSGRILGKDGKPAFGYVYAYNARTGDILDSTNSDSNGQYVVNGLTTQNVKIKYYTDAECWHRDAADFASATPVPVTAGQTPGGVDRGPCRR